MGEGSVEFAKVSYTLPSSAVLLRDISLRLEPGTVTALLGRSGSGKTTLLRMVNGLVRPTAGEVLVSGRVVEDDGLIELRRGIGYVIQESGLFPHMTVARNVGIAMELAGRSEGEMAARVGEVLGLAGIDAVEFGGRYPWQLSGGQRQRVGLARALAMGAPVLLMDEPFGALDPLTRVEMQDMLRGLLKRLKKTVLLVTHDLDEALYLADRIVLMREGRLVASLSTEEFLGSGEPEVAAYVSVFRRGSRAAVEGA